MARLPIRRHSAISARFVKLFLRAVNPVVERRDRPRKKRSICKPIACGCTRTRRVILRQDEILRMPRRPGLVNQRLRNAVNRWESITANRDFWNKRACITPSLGKIGVLQKNSNLVGDGRSHSRKTSTPPHSRQQNKLLIFV